MCKSLENYGGLGFRLLPLASTVLTPTIHDIYSLIIPPVIHHVITLTYVNVSDLPDHTSVIFLCSLVTNVAHLLGDNIFNEFGYINNSLLPPPYSPVPELHHQRGEIKIAKNKTKKNTC